LGCAGLVGIFGSTFPSIIEGNGKPNLEKMSRMAGERRPVSLTPFEAPKAPKISQTSPPDQSENHEEYSVEASAAIRSS
jgi:hypothetical protein